MRCEFNSPFRTILIITICLLTLDSADSHVQKNEPITRENLLRALEYGKTHKRERKNPSWFIKLVQMRGVDFRLTANDEREIRDRGDYLGRLGLDDLVAAISRSYHLKSDTAPKPAAKPECKGKSPGNPQFFSVETNYTPSGKLGDAGDVRILKEESSTVFEYTPNGRGPHEWEFKYLDDGNLNPEPAQFGGVMYLDPPNNFGTRCGGYDLSQFRRAVKWEARSLEGNINVEFIIGGVEWVWDHEKKKQTSPAFPDSMPRISLGAKILKKEWQPFEFPLADVPAQNFMRVLSAFAWVMTDSSETSAPKLTSRKQQRTIRFEVRKVRYER